MATRRLSGDIYDPREGEWVFDSSSLVNLRTAGLLNAVRSNFSGRTHLLEEVLKDELDRGPTGRDVRASAWFTEETLSAPQHLKDYARLRQRWSSAGGRDRGEAASIVFAKAHGFRFICDDGTGYSAARNWEGLCVMRTVDLLIAMVRCGWISADEAWEGFRRLEDAGEGLGVVPWGDSSNRQRFDQLCASRAPFARCF